MDIHDCNHASPGSHLTGMLSAGNVLTVEPGLLFQENVPRDPDLVESWMGELA